MQPEIYQDRIGGFGFTVSHSRPSMEAFQTFSFPQRLGAAQATAVWRSAAWKPPPASTQGVECGLDGPRLFGAPARIDGRREREGE